MTPEAALKGGVFEYRAANIVIQRWRVAGKIRFHDIEIPVQIVVRRGNAHTRLRFAISAERAASFSGDVFEPSVFLILIERTGRRIVGHVNVRPAIVIKIAGEHAETVGAIGLQDPRFLGDIRECSVAVVVVEDIFAAVQTGRAACDHHTFI